MKQQTRLASVMDARLTSNQLDGVRLPGRLLGQTTNIRWSNGAITLAGKAIWFKTRCLRVRIPLALLEKGTSS